LRYTPVGRDLGLSVSARVLASYHLLQTYSASKEIGFGIGAACQVQITTGDSLTSDSQPETQLTLSELQILKSG
jgi:hypothetical protein